MSRSTRTILDSPQTTIGARELLSVGECTNSGFVRKQGAIERRFKFLRWRQRFIALSRGCMYLFKNEYSSSPQCAVYLGRYTRCVRTEHNRMQWVFIIVPEDRGTDKRFVISCTTEMDRKAWMTSFKEEMIKAHKLTSKQISDHQKGKDPTDEYVYLEKALPNPPSSKTKRAPRERYSQAPTLAPEPESDDTDEDYTTINEEDVKPGAFVYSEPATTKTPPKAKPGPSKEKAKPKTTKTKPAKSKARTPPPCPKANIPSRESFEYPSCDRAEVEIVIMGLGEGDFLVRKSRNDDREVLSVKIEGTLKEFKIYEKDGTFTINNEVYFDSVEQMLEHYRQNTLPKKSTTLNRSYKERSPATPGYINLK